MHRSASPPGAAGTFSARVRTRTASWIHFEQAYRSLTDIGRTEEHTRALAAAGGERLGRAGVRAWKRADAPAAINLLSRSLELTPEASELACELGLAFFVTGEVDRARAQLTRATSAADRRAAARARVELGFLESVSEPGRAGELLAIALDAVPVLEADGDDRALGRTWFSIAHVRGGFFCEYESSAKAARQAVTHYRRAGWSASVALNHLGFALYFGPTRVVDATAECECLLQEFGGDHASEANILVWLAGLEAMRGTFDTARARIDRARQLFLELGLTTSAGDECARLRAFIETYAGETIAAERELRSSCAILDEKGQSPVLATRAGELAQVLYANGRFNEAETWARRALQLAGNDDLDAALTVRPVEAMLAARGGAPYDAEKRLRDLLATTPPDAVNHKAVALLALGEVLSFARHDSERVDAIRSALELFEQKGNVAAAERTRALLQEPAVRKIGEEPRGLFTT